MERSELTVDDYLILANRTNRGVNLHEADHKDYLAMLSRSMRSMYRKEYRACLDRMAALTGKQLTEDGIRELQRLIRRVQMFEHRQLIGPIDG